MRLKDKLVWLFFTICLIIPAESFLLPILFPLSIKITFHSNSKPEPEDSYHFQPVPVYREVVLKGSAHISPLKHSYGDGQKYGSSYGDGHTKVYTEEPYIRGHKYASGYGSTGGSIDGHFSVSSYPGTPTNHQKGSSYNSGSHYKGETYPITDYKETSGVSYDQGAGYGEIPPIHYTGTTYNGNSPPTHYKGTAYDDKSPPIHYKGTTYDDDKSPPIHYKGATYDDKTPSTHYKGTSYDDDTITAYEGNPYDDIPNPYKGSSQSKKPKIIYKNHGYIKAVGGSYKYTDYINGKSPNYTDDESPYIALTPGKTYAEIESAHKTAHSPKAYAAEEYSDLGANKYSKEYEHDASYIDDTLPAYKANIPRPRSLSKLKYEESASRYDRVLPEPPKNKTVYAGFGTSVYGDSYAKLVYVPKSLKISIKSYAHK